MDFTILHFAIHIVWRVNVICTYRKSGIARKTTIAYPELRLGNVYELSLDEIFNSRQTTKVQCRYSKECNACWINFHRKYDIILLRNLERFLPKRIIELFYGKYQWTDNIAETYQRYIKNTIC